MQSQQQKTKKNFRKRSAPAEVNQDYQDCEKISDHEDEDEEERRLALEEVKFLQKQRQRKSGIPALPSNGATQTIPSTSSNNDNNTNLNKNKIKRGIDGTHSPSNKNSEGGRGDGDNDDLVLQDTFAQETAVMVEDPNMLNYVEQELAKKRGRKVDTSNQIENGLKRAEDELYKIPDHLKVKRRNSEESSTQWTTGIAEVQLPIEYKLKNIEETEAAKKFLQERRLIGQTKSEFSIPSSYSADYFQRGRDYAEKLRREHPELYKDRSSQEDGSVSSQNDTGKEAAGQRQAATDQFMLERFRKRERHRVMRR